MAVVARAGCSEDCDCEVSDDRERRVDVRRPARRAERLPDNERVRAAAWVARCVGRADSVPLSPSDWILREGRSPTGDLLESLSLQDLDHVVAMLRPNATGC